MPVRARFVERGINLRAASINRPRAAVQGAIDGYRQAERDIEDQLLARTRIDLAGIPEATIALPAELDGPVEPAFARLGESIAGSLQAELGHELAALVIGDLFAQTSVRLAVSTGLVGAGQVSTVSTLGVGLAAGLLAERALRIVWGDPREELAGRLDQTLDELGRRVLDGAAGSTGLQSRLRREA
jgi:hypothetical protein